MELDEVRRFVLATILKAKRAETDPDAIGDDVPLGGDGLDLNSLAFLQTFVAVEQRYGFTFDDMLVANGAFVTVGDLVAFVGDQVRAHAAPGGRAH